MKTRQADNHYLSTSPICWTYGLLSIYAYQSSNRWCDARCTPFLTPTISDNWKARFCIPWFLGLHQPLTRELLSFPTFLSVRSGKGGIAMLYWNITCSFTRAGSQKEHIGPTSCEPRPGNETCVRNIQLGGSQLLEG